MYWKQAKEFQSVRLVTLKDSGETPELTSDPQ